MEEVTWCEGLRGQTADRAPTGRERRRERESMVNVDKRQEADEKDEKRERTGCVPGGTGASGSLGWSR